MGMLPVNPDAYRPGNPYIPPCLPPDQPLPPCAKPCPPCKIRDPAKLKQCDEDFEKCKNDAIQKTAGLNDPAPNIPDDGRGNAFVGYLLCSAQMLNTLANDITKCKDDLCGCINSADCVDKGK